MAWFDHDIRELDESMFLDEDAWTSDTDNNFEGDPDNNFEGDPADDDEVDSDSGFKPEEDNSGFDESVNEDDMIDSNYCDDEVEPSTIPQHDAEVNQYKDDPADWKYSNKEEEGTETVEVESFTDWDDLF